MSLRSLSAAVALSLTSVFVMAAPVTLSQTQTAIGDGEDLTFVFGSLLPSSGAGGLVTIRPAGGSTLGLDLSGAFPLESENFQVTFDGVSQGFFSCGGPSNNGATSIAGATDNSFNFNDCVFALPLSLLDAFLTDGSLSVGVLFGGDVSFANRGDQVNVELAYESAGTVPEPTSVALAALALLLGGGASRRFAKR